MKRFATFLALTALAAATAQATLVEVEVTGTVLFNGIPDAPLGEVGSGETMVVTFQVDSENFDEGAPGDTRGYIIDQPTFLISFSGGVNMGLMDPFPAGSTPYFGLIDGFPVSDGFFVSTSPFSPGGVPLMQDPINFNLDLGYEGDTLGSLDILDALGTYGFDGLTRFAYNLWAIFPDNVVMECDWESMVIREVVSTPTEQSTWGAVKALYQ